jgi:hypothetical protein
MATTEEVQHKLQNQAVVFYTWLDEKDKVWWIASMAEHPEEGTKQPTPESALSALIRELTR